MREEIEEIAISCEPAKFSYHALMLLRQILQVADSPLQPLLFDTIGVVDATHPFPQTLSFPIVISNARKEQGAYHYRVNPSRADRIEISRYAEFPQLTLLHEIGHFLDHLALNPIKSEFGTDHDPMFETLITLWTQSPPVVFAQKLLARYGHSETSRNRALLRHNLTARELWARSYMQWIVTRSANPSLVSQLQKLLISESYFAARPCTFQWDHEPFKPIMHAVDKVMESAGLL